MNSTIWGPLFGIWLLGMFIAALVLRTRSIRYWLTTAVDLAVFSGVSIAVLAGMAGALYGLNFSTVAASKFKFDTSILVLVFVVLGGIGNIRGSIISATLLTILPELLRAFANYRMLIYAIVLILVMLATNNPTLRGMVERIIPRGKGRKKEADEA